MAAIATIRQGAERASGGEFERPVKDFAEPLGGHRAVRRRGEVIESAAMNPTDRLKKKAAAAKRVAAEPHDPGSLPSGQLVLTPVEGRVTELRLAASDYVQRAIGCDLDDSEESLAFVDHYIDSVRSGGVLRDEVLELVAVALGVYLGEVIRTKFGGRWVSLPPEPSTIAARPRDASGAGSADTTPTGDTPILDSIDDPVGWRLQLAAVPLLADPIGMALRAIRRPEPGAELPAVPETALLPDSDDESEAETPISTGTGDLMEDGEDPVGFATTPALTAALRTALARLPPVSIDYYFSLTGRFETLTYVVELLAEMQHQEAEKNAPPAEADSDPESAADSAADSAAESPPKA